MALDAVLLDVGGTLLREHPPREEIYAAAAAARGTEVEPRAMRRLMHETAHGLPRVVEGHFRYSEGWFRHFIARLFAGELDVSADLLPGLEQELFARFSDPATFRLYDGAIELLDALRAGGLRLGIVSNWSERLPGILAGLGVAERVDFTLVSAVERCEKPEPEIFRLALERVGSAPERTVHAGNDLVLDVRGARESGILQVLVDHDRRLSLPQADPPPRVTDLLELERWIMERAR